MKLKNDFLCKLLVLFFSLLLFSCNAKQQEDNTKIIPERVIRNKILIILGKDYEERTGILNYLVDEYKAGQDNSPVSFLRYSDMVSTTKQPRLKLIAETIEESNASIVISLGIPDGAGRYLIKASEANPNISIISLLPMDEILPLEAASDVVADFQIPSADQVEANSENFTITDDDIMLLLTASIFAAEDINAKNKRINISPIEEFTQAFFTAQKILANRIAKNNYFITSHIDSDTGIPSQNYLIIYKNCSSNEQLNDMRNKTDAEYDEVDEKPETEIHNPDQLGGSA